MVEGLSFVNFKIKDLVFVLEENGDNDVIL